MKFEERVTVLCSQAVAADNETEALEILTELRSVLHHHIERLRSGLTVAYPKSGPIKSAKTQTAGAEFETLGFEPPIVRSAELNPTRDANTRKDNSEAGKPSSTRQQRVHEIGDEQHKGRATHLNAELTSLLQYYCGIDLDKRRRA